MPCAVSAARRAEERARLTRYILEPALGADYFAARLPVARAGQDHMPECMPTDFESLRKLADLRRGHRPALGFPWDVERAAQAMARHQLGNVRIERMAVIPAQGHACGRLHARSHQLLSFANSAARGRRKKL